jgi:hypothetical protein
MGERGKGLKGERGRSAVMGDFFMNRRKQRLVDGRLFGSYERREIDESLRKGFLGGVGDGRLF